MTRHLYLGAPPVCGDTTGDFAVFSRYVDVRSPCPTTPRAGRYLSDRGFLSHTPFAFSVPAGWTVLSMDAVNGAVGSPFGNGLVAQSTVTGDGFTVTMAPIPAVPRGTTGGPPIWAARQLAAWAAARPFATASRVRATTLGGMPGWQVDLGLRPSARPVDRCLDGAGCVSVFEVWLQGPGRPRSIGLYPGRPARAVLLDPGVGSAPLLVWIWSSPPTDDLADPDSEIRRVVDSLDFALLSLGPVEPPTGTTQAGASATRS